MGRGTYEVSADGKTLTVSTDEQRIVLAETARALGLERSDLYKKCQQLGIDLKAERSQT